CAPRVLHDGPPRCSAGHSTEGRSHSPAGSPPPTFVIDQELDLVLATPADDVVGSRGPFAVGQQREDEPAVADQLVVALIASVAVERLLAVSAVPERGDLMEVVVLAVDGRGIDPQVLAEADPRVPAGDLDLSIDA